MLLQSLIIIITILLVYLIFENQNEYYKNNYKIKHKFIYPSVMEQQYYSTMYNNNWIYDLKLPNLISINETTLDKL